MDDPTQSIPSDDTIRAVIQRYADLAEKSARISAAFSNVVRILWISTDAEKHDIICWFQSFSGKGPEKFIVGGGFARKTGYHPSSFDIEALREHLRCRNGGTTPSHATKTKRPVTSKVTVPANAPVVIGTDPSKVTYRDMVLLGMGLEDALRYRPDTDKKQVKIKLTSARQSLREKGYVFTMLKTGPATKMIVRITSPHGVVLFEKQDWGRVDTCECPTLVPIRETRLQRIVNNQRRSNGGVIRIESGSGK